MMTKVTVRQPIVHDATEVTVRGEALSAIIWQGRQWAVTAYGLERRDGTYFIEAQRLAKDLRSGKLPSSWIAHVGQKDWADLEDFATAFLVACSVHRVPLSKADVDLLLEHFAECADIAWRRRRVRETTEEA